MCLSGWNLKAAWKCLIMSRFVKHIHIPNKKIHPIRNDIWNNKRHQGRGQLVSVSDNISCRPTSRSIWLSVTNALGLNEWWKINRRFGGRNNKKRRKRCFCAWKHNVFWIFTTGEFSLLLFSWPAAAAASSSSSPVGPSQTRVTLYPFFFQPKVGSISSSARSFTTFVGY